MRFNPFFFFFFFPVPTPKRMRSSPVLAAPRAVVTAGSDPSPTCRPRVPRSGPGPSQEPPGRAPSLPAGPRGEPLVHYYWGVPFCPQGLDPDGYTQVGTPEVLRARPRTEQMQTALRLVQMGG